MRKSENLKKSTIFIPIKTGKMARCMCFACVNAYVLNANTCLHNRNKTKFFDLNHIISINNLSYISLCAKNNIMIKDKASFFILSIVLSRLKKHN